MTGGVEIPLAGRLERPEERAGPEARPYTASVGKLYVGAGLCPGPVPEVSAFIRQAPSAAHSLNQTTLTQERSAYAQKYH